MTQKTLTQALNEAADDLAKVTGQHPVLVLMQLRELFDPELRRELEHEETR